MEFTEYKELNKVDFDAVVTGELTHYALWLENLLNHIISDYFVGIDEPRSADFRRLFLYRDGLTFQGKIEIVRGMLPLLGQEAEKVNLKSILNRVEEFKSWRNAMAHGHDVSDDDSKPELKIEMVNRSGKERVMEITPQSHIEKMDKVEELLSELKKARNHLANVLGRE